METAYLLEGRVYTRPAEEILGRAEVPFSQPFCSLIPLSTPKLRVLSPKCKSLHTHVLNKKDKEWVGWCRGGQYEVLKKKVRLKKHYVIRETNTLGSCTVHYVYLDPTPNPPQTTGEFTSANTSQSIGHKTEKDIQGQREREKEKIRKLLPFYLTKRNVACQIFSWSPTA